MHIFKKVSERTYKSIGSPYQLQAADPGSHWSSGQSEGVDKGSVSIFRQMISVELLSQGIPDRDPLDRVPRSIS